MHYKIYNNITITITMIMIYTVTNGIHSNDLWNDNYNLSSNRKEEREKEGQSQQQSFNAIYIIIRTAHLRERQWFFSPFLGWKQKNYLY